MKNFRPQITKGSYNIIFLVAIIASITSCRSGGRCEEPMNIYQSEIVVAFKDQSTGTYLYSELNPLYNKDSLKIFDPGGDSLVILKRLNVDPVTLVQYWDLSFGNLYNEFTDANSFNAEFCKDYTIKYRYNESDTIKVCFKSKTTKCGSVFEILKVYYQGQLIGTDANTTGMLLTVIKN